MINVSILFPGGCYGTFIEWCLNYFSDPNFDQTLPFTETGSSHKFLGNHLLNCEVLTNNIDAGRRYNICRLHPKSKKEDNIIKNCNFVKSVSNRVVYIYPGYDSFVWTVNNKFEKIWAQGWLKHQESDITDNLKQWNNKSLELIEDWEIREFLSFYIYQQHVAECEVDHIDLLKQKFNDFYFINVKEIRDILASIHIGQPRKDGLVTNNMTPTTQELTRRMGDGILTYTKTQDGRFIPIWKESI